MRSGWIGGASKKIAILLATSVLASCASDTERGDAGPDTLEQRAATAQAAPVETELTLRDVEVEQLLNDPEAQRRAPNELAALRRAFDDWVAAVRGFRPKAEVEAARQEYGKRLREAYAAGRFARNIVVVLPPEEGDVGGVEVTSGDDRAVLDEPYEAVSLDFVGYVLPTTATANEVSTTFSASAEVRPIYANEYDIFFGSGSTRLDAPSRAFIDQIARDIVERKATEVLIEGYADRSGPASVNLALSQRRADAVRDALLSRDLPDLLVTVEAYGEERPDNDYGTTFSNERRVFVQVR